MQALPNQTDATQAAPLRGVTDNSHAKNRGGAAALQKAIASLASSVVEKRARKDARAQDLAHELRIEAMSAAGEAIARRFAPDLRDSPPSLRARFAPGAFACFMARLSGLASGDYSPAPARFVRLKSGATVFRPSPVGPVNHPRPLLSALPLAAWLAAHKAIDSALRKMSHGGEADRVAESQARRRAKIAGAAGNIRLADELTAQADALRARRVYSVGPRVIDVSGMADELIDPTDKSKGADAEREAHACAFVRAQASAYRLRIRERADELGTQGASKSAGAHLRRLDAWEAKALALARGETGADLSVLSRRTVGAREVAESLAIFDARERPLAHDGRGSVTGSRVRREARGSEVDAAGFEAFRRMLAFIGERPAAQRPARELSEAEKRENRYLSARLAYGAREADKAGEASAPVRVRAQEIEYSRFDVVRVAPQSTLRARLIRCAARNSTPALATTPTPAPVSLGLPSSPDKRARAEMRGAFAFA